MSDSSSSTSDCAINLASLCPCASGVIFGECCQPVLAGAAAASAEVLMRSRYTAFVLHNDSYLLYSWHPDTRPARIDFDPAQRWLGLKIKSRQEGGREDHSGVVCFAARYKRGGRGHRLEECSRFVRLSDPGDDKGTEKETDTSVRVSTRWVYIDGEVAG